MVNANDPTRRRQLRVMKLKASRLKLKFDPTTADILLNSSIPLNPSHFTTSSSTLSSTSSSPVVITTSEQKKKARQIRNREAANVSRQRYLAEGESLKQRVGKLEDENKMLREYIAKLHSENPQPQPQQNQFNFEMKYIKSENYCTKELATFY